jgi:hypothetical protein
VINIDYYMDFAYHTLYQPEVMISAREPIGSWDDISTRADKGYDMKNDML